MPGTVTVRRAEDPELLRGSLVTLRRRCGKSNCRCAHEGPHETPALSYSEGGRTKTVTLGPQDVPAVEAAVERYETARAALEAQALAGIQAFAGRRAGGRGRRARR